MTRRENQGTHTPPPKIDGAPGLKWLPRSQGRWEARWRPRGDLVRAGYPNRSTPVWRSPEPGATPNAAALAYIKSTCDILQAEMLVWGRGGLPQLPQSAKFRGTLRSLIECYQTDPDSPYRKKLAYATRGNYDNRCRRLILDHGDQPIGDTFIEDAKVDGIKVRTLLRWHEQWESGGRTASAHGMVAMLRTLMSFGAVFLEDDECARVKAVLSAMRFKTTKPRKQKITAAQAIAVRAKAHELGLPSIALAQAFQFECTLRQKDVIGEWRPMSEPGVSDITSGNDKWMVGLRWSEIDENLILRHTTNKRQKDIEVNLRLAPMVLEEFARLGTRPTSGPIIVFETTGIPYYSYQFRREWRIVARAAGVPANVYNMDSRAGAISEAFMAGAQIEHIKHAATHSNISTTEIYDRTAIEATADVMRTRVEHRNKS